jgi:protein subunit release factor A
MLTLEIRPGEGGDDAASFALELLNAYTNFATRMG